MTAVAVTLDVIAVALLVHTVVNAVLLRRPPLAPAAIDEPVSVLLPVRNEAARLPSSLPALLDQRGLDRVEVLVYDDASTDATADVVRSLGSDAVRVVPTEPLPSGWLGKPHACAALAAAARGTVLVFVDADVVLAPDAVARAVAMLRGLGWGFASPYPRQVAVGAVGRLVQPLLTWSWLTLLPLRLAERSRRPSLVAANGQLLVADAAAYRAAGGHQAVRDAVVEDVALARALRASGATGGFADGRDLAACRMYDDTRSLVEGYAKSLWTAFGSPAGAVAVALLLLAVYVLPWGLLAVTPLAWPAAVAGPAGRLVAAVRAGNEPRWDAVWHPLSILTFVALVGISLRRRRLRALSWKARPVG